jgi:hypothetical protein
VIFLVAGCSWKGLVDDASADGLGLRERMLGLESSGRMEDTGSSRPMRPRATHWSAEMLMRILPAEPRVKVLLGSIGGADGERDW